MIQALLDAANQRIDAGLDVSDSIMTRGEINAIMPPNEPTWICFQPASSNYASFKSAIAWTCAPAQGPMSATFQNSGTSIFSEEIQREGNTTILVST